MSKADEMALKRAQEQIKKLAKNQAKIKVEEKPAVKSKKAKK